MLFKPIFDDFLSLSRNRKHIIAKLAIFVSINHSSVYCLLWLCFRLCRAYQISAIV